MDGATTDCKRTDGGATMAACGDLPAGDRLGRYQIVGPLGAGGMGRGRAARRREVQRAATRYLSNLLAEHGSESFMLALAGYNYGETKLRRELHDLRAYRKEERDFWRLYRLKRLSQETREYVPLVLAAAIVFSSPERYGLK